MSAATLPTHTAGSTGSAPSDAPPASGPGAEQPPADGDQVVGERLTSRLRRWKAPLAALVLLLAVTVATVGLRDSGSKVPLAIDNHQPDGAQALAQVLSGYSISVHSVSSVDAAVDAAGQGATVVVLNVGSLTDSQRADLAAGGGDVVVLGTLYQDLRGLTRAIATGGTSADASTTLSAQCTDDDAKAAAMLHGSRGSVVPDGSDPEVVGCFPVGEGAYAYATAPLAGDGQETGATLRLIADATIARNDHLTDAGNAALLVRTMGHHEEVVWLDGDRLTAPSVFSTRTVPPWLPVLLLQLGLTVAVLALVQGRRFGRLVTEPLPVVVRAVETTIGRGRLYRRAGARDHAALALRAGAALRLGRRLGLPPGAGRGQLVHAVAEATSLPPDAIDQALYGPPPTTDQGLADLAHQLDQLESEVHPQ